MVGAAVAVLAVSVSPSARPYGCGPYGDCREWRDCRYHHCYAPCDWQGGCYYGPAEIPSRHKWRPRETRPPAEHAERDAVTPPLPARAQRETASAAEPERAAEPEPMASQRREAASRGDIPDRYRNANNEVGHTLTAIEAGAPLYRDNCAACHGASGEGDGPRAQDFEGGLPVLPQTLAQPDSTDAYLLWTIMEGGEPIGTEKPAFKGELTRREAWQIIAYMRAGFPARGSAEPVRQTMRLAPDADR